MSGPESEPEERDPAAVLLQDAIGVVTGPRRQDYGTQEENWGTIAELWTTYLRGRGYLRDGIEITPVDHAAMMELLKISRLIKTPAHRDTWLDVAGYAAGGWRVANLAEPKEGVTK